MKNLFAMFALLAVVAMADSAYARGGGGSGGGGGGGKKAPKTGGGAPNTGGAGKPKGAGKTGKTGTPGSKNPEDYLLAMQEEDAQDNLPDFLFDALDEATVENRAKDLLSDLYAMREKQSTMLRADDLPRP